MAGHAALQRESEERHGQFSRRLAEVNGRVERARDDAESASSEVVAAQKDLREAEVVLARRKYIHKADLKRRKRLVAEEMHSAAVEDKKREDRLLQRKMRAERDAKRPVLSPPRRAWWEETDVDNDEAGARRREKLVVHYLCI